MFTITLQKRIAEGRERIAVVGLGYVGLPIAVGFSKQANVIGFDIHEQKIAQYRKGIDATCEVGDEEVRTCTVEFTNDERRLEEARFIIVAVPTPVDAERRPDLTLLKNATTVVGRHLSKGAIVVFESTVYPGATEEICLPILERESGLRLGEDFKLGYSPERINPGDKEHRLETIVKVVSASDDEALEEIAAVYAMVAKAGVYRAPSIRVAEAAKVIENSQRDINIAFMNELAMLFHKLGLDTNEVLEAAATKWNFLPFRPGLVGGHCVGVDPYYLTHKAAEAGYDARMITAGREINDGMAAYVAEETVAMLKAYGVSPEGAQVALLGVTFKENCPDTRNSRAMDMIPLLEAHGVTVTAADPLADPEETAREYGVTLTPLREVRQADAVILAVAHEEWKQWPADRLAALFDVNGPKLLVDVKGICNKQTMEQAGFRYWRL